MSNPETLSIGEVAEYFGWTPRFVERLAVGGKLPGSEVGGQWRFRRADLVDWLDQKIQTLDAARVAELEHKLEAELESSGALGRPHQPGVLASRLSEAGIALHVQADSASVLLKELVDLAGRTGNLRDRELLHASLIEREALCSTALPDGVAICHPRHPVPAALRDALLCFARTEKPIAFGAENGEPTQLFFLLCSLDDRAHLHGLARLVRVLKGPTLAALRRATDAGEVISILRRRELEIEPSPTSHA
jgi:PTS system nitrogen regulatory IIA component